MRSKPQNLQQCGLIFFDEGSRLSGLKFINMTLLTMTQERFSNLTVLNCHKERTAKFALPPTSMYMATGPRTLKTAPQALLGVLTLKMLVSNNNLQWKKKQQEKPTEHNQGWASMMNIISTG